MENGLVFFLFSRNVLMLVFFGQMYMGIVLAWLFDQLVGRSQKSEWKLKSLVFSHSLLGSSWQMGSEERSFFRHELVMSLSLLPAPSHSVLLERPALSPNGDTKPERRGSQKMQWGCYPTFIQSPHSLKSEAIPTLYHVQHGDPAINVKWLSERFPVVQN